MNNKSLRVLFNLLPSKSKQNTLATLLNKLFKQNLGGVVKLKYSLISPTTLKINKITGSYFI